jgi:uncharacterized sulfatase
MATVATDRDPGTMEQLRRGLKDPDSGVRYWATQGVLIRGREAVKAAEADMRNALGDESPTVRVIAARALGQFGDEADVRAALKVLGDLAPPDRNGAYTSILTLNALDALGDRAAGLRTMLAAMPPTDPASPARANGYVARLIEEITGKAPARTPAKANRAKAKKKALETTR